MRVTSKGQVTIPKEIRDRLGIGPGSEVEFGERDSLVSLEKKGDADLSSPENFEDWATSVAGTFDTRGMDGKAYVDWLRRPRDDIDSR